MILQKKIDRALNWLKEKSNSEQYNHGYSDDLSQDSLELSNYDPKAEWDAQNKVNDNFGIKDIVALIISSIMVFGPIFLILTVLLFLLYPGLNAIKY
ncbi:MAG: hypothetical protein WDA24_09055 [Tissierellales bacterium]